MNTYGLFYNGELEERFEATEELAKQRFAEILEIETQEGEQLYDSIELYELIKIQDYKMETERDETK